MGSILLSICITSYNRVKELERTIRSVDYFDGIEIIVSEDCSPKREEIKNMINELIPSVACSLRLNLNKHNLGYDNNLGMLKSLAKGKFFVYMSDDDVFVPGALKKLCVFLESHDIVCGFTPFYINKTVFREYNESFHIGLGIEDKARHIKDGILFSGLVFNTDLARDIKSEKFLNYNYFQVYLLLSLLTLYGGDYINIPLVDCIGDGENAFGLVESSDGIAEMKNRKSVLSLPPLHKGLIKTIKEFDKDFDADIFKTYERNYGITLFPSMCAAKEEGQLSVYMKNIRELGLNLGVWPILYYILISVLGVSCAKKIMNVPRCIYKYIKRNRRTQF